MKKIILSFAVSLAATALFAAEPADSLGYLMGNTQGAMINQNLSKNFISADKNFKNSLVRGLETVFSADTTDIGYFEGLEMGLNMVKQLVEISRLGAYVNRQDLIDQLRKGILADKVDQKELDANKARLKMLVDPLQKRAEDMQREAQRQQRAMFDSIAARNDAAGKNFIDSIMAADKSVKKTESGLAYKIIEPGKGKKPETSDLLEVRYIGRHINGDIFDQTQERPIEFNMGGVIKGFGEGLGMMKKGAKYILYIPGNLGYGKRGTGNGVIMPDETLIFEVELADIKKK